MLFVSFVVSGYFQRTLTRGARPPAMRGWMRDDSQLTMSLPYRAITHEQLRQMIAPSEDSGTESERPSFIIFDVRDPNRDFPGGHIRGAINVPSQLFRHRLPELIREYSDRQNVIIHCMYSRVCAVKLSLLCPANRCIAGVR